MKILDIVLSIFSCYVYIYIYAITDTINICDKKINGAIYTKQEASFQTLTWIHNRHLVKVKKTD